MSEAIRLLLVEDNENDAELLRLELERAGFELDYRRVENDADLRRELSEHDWDMVISDFSLAGFDGLKALRTARELRPELPFVFVSGAPGEKLTLEAKQAGALDYVPKTELSRLPEIVRQGRTLPKIPLPAEDSESLVERGFDSYEQFAHDFNNLLAVIVSYSRFAQKGVEKDSRPYLDMQKVLDAAKDLEALTGKLRARSSAKES